MKKSHPRKATTSKDDSFTERLRRVLRERYPVKDTVDRRYRYGIDQARLLEDLRKRLGRSDMPSAATIGKLINGRSGNSEWVPLIADVLGVRALWLAHGIEPKADSILPHDVRMFAYRLVDFPSLSPFERAEAMHDIMQLLLRITATTKRNPE